MNRSFSVSFPWPFLTLFLLSALSCAPARAQAVLASGPQAVYVYFHRSSGHVKLSTPEIFQQVVSEIQEYLSANRVATLTEGTVLASGSNIPLSAVQQMARDSGAGYLLYVVVDRPVTKWSKVTVQCYDASSRRIWQEEATSGGGLSSSKAAHRTLKKLREELNRRLGQPGLLQTTSWQQSAPAASSSEQKLAPTGSTPEQQSELAVSDAQPDDSRAALRLANGTPVHLMLAESVSSKTAQPASTVKLQVLGDVKVGDLVVIANRAPATATIETAKSAARAWHAGTLLLKLDKVMLLSQQQQPLRAWNAAKGKDTGAGADWTNAVLQSYGFALFFLPFAPLQHGNQAIMPRGTVLEAAINGDVLLPRAVIEGAQPKPAEPRHGPASVTFYYPDLGEGASVSVWCGEVKVGSLKRGGKFRLTLSPGRYWLRTWNSKRSPATALDVEDGGEEYVSVITASHRTGLDVTWQEHFAVVPHDVGELQSSDTNTAKSRNVQDTAKVNLTLLQSDPQVKKGK